MLITKGDILRELFKNNISSRNVFSSRNSKFNQTVFGNYSNGCKYEIWFSVKERVSTLKIGAWFDMHTHNTYNRSSSKHGYNKQLYIPRHLRHVFICDKTNCLLKPVWSSTKTCLALVKPFLTWYPSRKVDTLPVDVDYRVVISL